MDTSFEANQHRRGLFSSEVEAYELGRPGYPERVYELLTEMCGLGPGTRVVEIGPGTGQATSRLLELGAAVTGIELGPELAERLRTKHAGDDLTVLVGAFEEVDLASGQTDLVVAATSFHWVPTEAGLRRCAEVLRPGGWFAPWWAYFGDPERPDPFHEALLPVLEREAPEVMDVPSAGGGATMHPYALNADKRSAEIDATGAFGPVTHEVIRWTGRHTAAEIRAMFATFSPWIALPVEQRTHALDALEALARDEFGGIVERPYLTPIYLAQRLDQT